MKWKKMLWGILFSGLILCPVQVLASGTLSGIGLLAGEEEANTPDIYQVTLPTGGDFGVILDPEGLLSLSEEGEYDSSWAGKIHTVRNGGALFVNRSSFPVLVKVGISVEQDRNGTPTDIALLSEDTCVDDDVWPQMYLTVIPGAAKIRSMEDFVPSDLGIPILANGNRELTTFSFLLDGADYELDEETGEYVLVEDEENYDSASFIFGGRVNKNADWSPYVGANKKSFIIRTVYTIQKQGSYDEERLYRTDEDAQAPYALTAEEF
ncbi:MAG: hypothetical protein NC399_02040 [Muribaculum sp.]|nr:hypothetical protein [Muribaculum sp.]